MGRELLEKSVEPDDASQAPENMNQEAEMRSRKPGMSAVTPST
jgi:hypothetical protein